MKERITEVFNYYNWTQQDAGESLGVSKASISHILSGRNNPSLDFVMQIVKVKPEISLEWIVLGKGQMLNYHESIAKIEKPSLDKQAIADELKSIEHSLDMINREIVYRLNKIKEEIKKV